MRTVPKETGITVKEPAKLYQISQNDLFKPTVFFMRIPEIDEHAYINYEKKELVENFKNVPYITEESYVESYAKRNKSFSYVKNLNIEEVEELKVISYTVVTLTINTYHIGSGVRYVPFKKFFGLLNPVRRETFYYIDQVEEPTIIETEHSYISTEVRIEDAPTFNLTIIKG